MKFTRIFNYLFFVLIIFMSFFISKINIPTAVLTASYAVVFLLSNTKICIEKKKMKHLGYSVAGLGGLVLYTAGTRNDIVVMSLVLGVGGAADILLQTFRNNQPTED